MLLVYFSASLRLLYRSYVTKYDSFCIMLPRLFNSSCRLSYVRVSFVLKIVEISPSSLSCTSSMSSLNRFWSMWGLASLMVWGIMHSSQPSAALHESALEVLEVSSFPQTKLYIASTCRYESTCGLILRRSSINVLLGCLY